MQLISYGTTTLNIEVVLGRQSPSFSLKLLRRMINIAQKADERMRQVISLKYTSYITNNLNII